MYSANGAKYTLYTNMVNASTARRTCNEQGAHLAVYSGLLEQAAVEAYYMDQVGCLQLSLQVACAARLVTLCSWWRGAAAGGMHAGGLKLQACAHHALQSSAAPAVAPTPASWRVLTQPPPPPPAMQGWLIPLYHGSYWMGLTAATPGAGNFRWADSSPGPGAGFYTHWGTDSDGAPEPNNMFSPELCAAANSSQTYDNPEAWGWSDTRCNTKLPFICKQTRE